MDIFYWTWTFAQREHRIFNRIAILETNAALTLGMGLDSLYMRRSFVHSFSLIPVWINKGGSIWRIRSNNFFESHFNFSDFYPISFFQRDLLSLTKYFPYKIILNPIISVKQLFDLDFVMLGTG